MGGDLTRWFGRTAPRASRRQAAEGPGGKSHHCTGQPAPLVRCLQRVSAEVSQNPSTGFCAAGRGNLRRVPACCGSPPATPRAPVWRPHARGGHHPGPRRHSEDSHPPRAPDRGARASSTAVRPVRLELTGADLIRRRCLLRPLAPTVRPPAASGACSRPGGPLTAVCGTSRRTARAPGRPDYAQRRYGAAAGW